MSKLKFAHPSQLCVHNVWPIPLKAVLGGLRLACKERYRRETRKAKEGNDCDPWYCHRGQREQSCQRSWGYMAAMFVNCRRVLMARDTSLDKCAI